MAKANMTLANGTRVNIEGTTEEVAQLLATMGQAASAGHPLTAPLPAQKRAKRNARKREGETNAVAPNRQPTVDIAAIANTVKSCDESGVIEAKILDRSSQVDRTLLSLYIVHKYLEPKGGLTSGDINRVTTQLGIPISTANASKTLSGTASRYVMADAVRKKGIAVRYCLSRKGLQYLESVLERQQNELK